MDLYQEFIAKSRYCRYLPDEDRRENWDETVARYFDFFELHLARNHHYKLDLKLRTELEQAVINLEVMPSMRCLMTAGKALERNNIAGYNCSYLAVDDPKAFDEAMMILLCGTGVGFSVERQDIAKLPIVPDKLKEGDCFVIEDSKEGWAHGLRKIIKSLYLGKIPTWDVSKVRPAGTPLKTFGGRASGPEPLVELFNFIVKEFKEASGRRLNSIQCHDIMCKIGETVVVGGVRRSAMISLSNLSDMRMQGAKMGAWWEQHSYRALANNSIAYTERPDVGVFMKEWMALYESKSGERGIFNRMASENQVQSIGRREGGHAWGTNPCFSGNMKLLTSEGYKTFEELNDKQVEIVSFDGSISTGKVWCSGEKLTVDIKFLDETPNISCTPDHVFMLNDGSECQAQDLQGKRVMQFFEIKNEFHKESFFAGFIQGDGSTSRISSRHHKGIEIYIGKNDSDVGDFLDMPIGINYSKKAREIAEKYELSKNTLPTRELPSKIVGDFLSGLFSANGSVIKTSRIALKTTCEELSKQLVVILKNEYDIDAYITTNKTKENAFSNGNYFCKESYDINIGRYKDILKFSKHISFIQKYKQESLKNLLIERSPFVCSVTERYTEKVYDFTEPKNHWGVVEGIVVHNCSEIILRPQEFCNLSEVVVREHDTYVTLKRKIELATILGTFQSTLIHLPYLRKIWTKNTEEERLLGVSLTGIMDNKLMSTNNAELKKVLTELRATAVKTNKAFANKLNIPQSASITCVKPSGTVSQLCDSASGIHTRHSPYYIRRIRGDIKDPLTQFMIKAGVENEPCVMKPNNTIVFSFPKKAPKHGITRTEITAKEHLDIWLTYQKYFCEHKPSITVSVKEDEWPEVGAFVWKHFDEISGVSFLPEDGGSYKQAPYEEINKEQYDAMLKRSIKHIDWSEMVEIEDNVEGAQMLACSAGVCEI